MQQSQVNGFYWIYSVKFMMHLLKCFLTSSFSLSLLFLLSRPFVGIFQKKKFYLSKKNNGDNYMLSLYLRGWKEMILALTECDNYFSTWINVFLIDAVPTYSMSIFLSFYETRIWWRFIYGHVFLKEFLWHTIYEFNYVSSYFYIKY